jgi:hypothetical protein
VTGSYELTRAYRFQPVNTDGFSLEIYSTSESCQLWATFTFGELNGLMRLVPLEALASKPDVLLYLPDFEDACTLAPGAFPSPKSKEWLMRWRGKDEQCDETTIVGGETRAQGQFTFGLDKSGMQITFVIIHNYKHLIFHGSKVAELNVQSTVEQQNLLTQWENLYNPIWEQCAGNPSILTRRLWHALLHLYSMILQRGILKTTTALNKAVANINLSTRMSSP